MDHGDLMSRLLHDHCLLEDLDLSSGKLPDTTGKQLECLSHPRSFINFFCPLSLQFVFIIFNCVCLCMCIHVQWWLEVPDTPELELHLMWVLGVRLGASVRTAWALSC